MNKTTRHLLLFFVIVASPFLNQCASDNQSINLSEFGDETTVSGDQGTFFPSENGSTDTCDVDLTTGECKDDTQTDAPVRLTQTDYDFGLSEQDHIECIAISIPQGLPFTAEFDKAKTSNTIIDGEQKSEFAFQTAPDAYSSDRVEGSEQLTICYQRLKSGSHTGQVRLVINPASASGSQAYVLTLRGETTLPLFTITSPSPNQIFHQNQNAGVDNEEGDYLINVSGQVNPNLFSIIKGGTSAEITIDVDGVKLKTNFDPQTGSFSRSDIPVSQTPGRYSVTFSLESVRDQNLTKSIPIVVAGLPQLAIEVRNQAGGLINNANPTDAPNLIIGFKIPNLNVSGSNSNEMMVSLSDMTFNGTPLAPNQSIYYDAEKSWCNETDDEGKEKDYPEFDSVLTYCVPLKNIPILQNGINVISATASNSLGSLEPVTYDLILDYGKPQIHVVSPKRNQLFSPSTTKITITGYVNNYAPVDPSLQSQIPAKKGDDIGSWCQAQGESDSSCPVSGLKLWFNISPDDTNDPIYIYPDPYTTPNTTLEDRQESVFSETKTRGQCQDINETSILIPGGSGETSTSATGTITTTVTNDDGTTTIYQTESNGRITEISADGSETILFAPLTGTGKTTTSQLSDGIFTTTSKDPSQDFELSVSTNTSTGEVSQTRQQRLCNIPYGYFKVTIDTADLSHHARMNLYTNVFQLRGQSISGHRTINVVTFHTGITNHHSKKVGLNETQGTLSSGQLGIPNKNCETSDRLCLKRAPVMASISEGSFDRTTAEGQKMVQWAESILNDNLDFADFANGWTFWPKDENDRIDIEADFQREWQSSDESHGEPYTDFKNLPEEWRKKFIQQGLHSNIMAQKYWALIRYVELVSGTDRPNCSERPDLCFFQRNGNPVSEYDVAQDSCGEVITTAFVPVGDLRHVAKHITNNDVNEITYLPEWSDAAGGDVAFDDFVSGRWVVQKIDLKPNGFIDADICLMPNDPNDTELNDQIAFFGCDADVSKAKVPAFWGHFISYNLVHGGLLGPMIDPFMIPGWVPGIGGDAVELQIDDPNMPLIWSVGKIRLSLKDALQIRTFPTTNGWSTAVQLSKETISIVEEDELYDLNSAEAMASKSIQIEPFMNCASYYQEQFPGLDLPFGCTDDPTTNDPFILEMNSSKGQQIFQRLMYQGRSDYLLKVVWQGVIQTFRKIFACIDNEMVNPLINPVAFPYPAWANEESKFETSFDLDEFVPGLTASTNLGNSDIKVFDGGMILRVPLSVSMDDVLFDTPFSTKLSGIGLTSNIGAYQDSITANKTGHLIRSEEALSRVSFNANSVETPLLSEQPENEVFAGISLNIEEIVNAAAYLAMKSGPLSLLDTFDLKDDLEPRDDWTVGVDKVVLARFDICDIAGKIPTDLPVGNLFATIGSSFSTDTLHINLKINKDDPLTLAMSPLPGANNNAADFKIGFSNIILEIKELNTAPTTSPEQQVYLRPYNQAPVVTLKLDGTISAKAIYHKDNRNLKIFIDDYEQQNLHLSVLSSGGNYDDVNVVSDLTSTVIKFAFERLTKQFVTDPNALGTVDITLASDNSDSSAFSVAKLLDAQFDFNVTLDDNSPCEGNVPLYEDEYENQTGDAGNSEQDTNQPTQEQIESRERLANILNQMSIFKNRETPIEAEDLNYPTEVPQDVLDSDEPWHSYCNLSPRYDLFYENATNPLKEILCNFGLKDVYFTSPTMIFDSENGYIHLSSELALELLNK